MELKQLEYLRGFEKRMHVVAVADFIVNRKNKSTEIENRFEPGEIENLLFSILDFVMEQNLAENAVCTIKSITAGLKDMLECYRESFTNEEVEVLARYLVKDILQNKSEVKEAYPCMNYIERKMESIPVQLLVEKLTDDDEIGYELTELAYNFMFRSKEVDDELGFELQVFKTKLQITRKNYKEAVEGSIEMIHMLQSKRKSVQQFLKRLRADIFSVSATEYSKMTRESNIVLEEQCESILEIIKMLEAAKESLNQEEAQAMGAPDQKIIEAKENVLKIENNIRGVLSLQQSLICETKDLKEIYHEQIQEAMHLSRVKTYDFNKVVLQNLERYDGVMNGQSSWIVKQLRTPLYLLEIDKVLNLLTGYGPQSKLREDVEDGQEFKDEELEEDNYAAEIARKNETYVHIVRLLLQFASKHVDGFLFHEFFLSIQDDPLFPDMLEERRIFIVMLTLFAEERGGFYIRDQVESSGNNDLAMGEFDVGYCLGKLNDSEDRFFGIDALFLSKTKEEFQYCIDSDPISGFENIIKISDFRIEVEKDGADGTSNEEGD